MSSFVDWLEARAGEYAEGEGIHPDLAEGATAFARMAALEARRRIANAPDGALWICSTCHFVGGKRADIRAEQPWCGPCRRERGIRVNLDLYEKAD